MVAWPALPHRVAALPEMGGGLRGSVASHPPAGGSRFFRAIVPQPAGEVALLAEQTEVAHCGSGPSFDLNTWAAGFAAAGTPSLERNRWLRYDFRLKRKLDPLIGPRLSSLPP
jgi:hypothetical protein